MGVDALERLLLAGEPGGEIAPFGRAAGRHAQTLQELPVGQEIRVLPAVLEAVAVVEVAGAAREIGRVRDVEHLTLGVLELLQRQRRLATAGAADDDQWRGQAIDRLLRVVEGNHLVKQVNVAAVRVDIAHRHRFAAGRRGVDRWNLLLVDRGAAQKARAVVGMLLDHFEHQGIGDVAMAQDGKQQPIGVIELGTVELAVAHVGELLHLGLTEIVTLDGVAQLGVLRFDAGGVQADVFENLHGWVRGRRQ